MLGTNNLTSVPTTAITPENQGNVPMVQPGPFQNASVTNVTMSPEDLAFELSLQPPITRPRNNNTAEERAKEEEWDAKCERNRDSLRENRTRTEQQRVTTRVPDRGPLNSTPRNSPPRTTSQRPRYSSLFTSSMQSGSAEGSSTASNTTCPVPATPARPTPTGEGVLFDDSGLFSGESAEDDVQMALNPPANNTTMEPTTDSTTHASTSPETSSAQEHTHTTGSQETSGAEGTTQGAEEPAINSALHFESFREGAEGYQQGQDRFTLQLTAESGGSLSDFLKAILQPSTPDDPTFDGNVHWSESTESAASAIVSIDGNGLLRALGTVPTVPGLLDMSLEGVNTFEVRANIHEQAQERGEAQRQNTFTQRQRNTRVCVPREYIDERANEGNAFVCRETSVYTEEVLDPNLRAFYEERCVDTTFLVSDGIDGASSVSGRVHNTVSLDAAPTYDPDTGSVSSASTLPGAQPLNATQTSLTSNMGTRLTEVMARYCTTTAYVDVRATQQVQGDAAADIPDSTTLSSVRLLQALAEVLAILRRNATQDVDGGGPEMQIVIYDVDEVPNYLPDLRPLRAMVRSLTELGVNIYAYSSSAGSYLARIRGIRVTSSIAEIVARTSERGLTRGYPGTAAAVGLTVIACGVLLLKYVRNRPSDTQPESEPIRPTPEQWTHLNTQLERGRHASSNWNRENIRLENARMPSRNERRPSDETQAPLLGATSGNYHQRSGSENSSDEECQQETGSENTRQGRLLFRRPRTNENDLSPKRKDSPRFSKP